MTVALWAPALLLGLSAALFVAPRTRLTSPSSPSSRSAVPPAPSSGWMHRWRPLWCGLGGLGALVFVGGTLGWIAGPVVAAGCWVAIGRAESSMVRREREAVRRDLPYLVRLLAAALAAGASPADAVVEVAGALPGPAADRLAPVAGGLRLGADPGDTWRRLESDPELAPLGRTLARSHATGSSVVSAVERLGDELARDTRAATEDRARAVGVKAAVPLGLCLLPAFVLIGVVPVVGGLLVSLAL